MLEATKFPFSREELKTTVSGCELMVGVTPMASVLDFTIIFGTLPLMTLSPHNSEGVNHTYIARLPKFYSVIISNGFHPVSLYLQCSRQVVNLPISLKPNH